MRTSTAFIAGAGTVVVAIATGLGGGLLLGNIMNPHQPKHPSSEVARLEQRSAPQPIQAVNANMLPLLRSAAPTANEAPTASPSSASPVTKVAITSVSTRSQDETGSAALPLGAAAPPVAAVEPPRAGAEDSFARARDADVKREMRRTDDRRKSERHRQTAEKRRLRQREDSDLNDVEAKVREITDSRPVFAREEPRSNRIFSLFESD